MPIGAHADGDVLHTFLASDDLSRVHRETVPLVGGRGDHEIAVRAAQVALAAVDEIVAGVQKAKYEAELPPEFAGTWRFEGEGAMGPYAGEMTIRREGGRLTYIRKYDDQLPTETGGESGRLLQVGRLALTQQKITPGLLTLFGGNRKRVPQRHGVYRVETPFKLSGTSFTAATMIRTRLEIPDEREAYREHAGRVPTAARCGA